MSSTSIAQQRSDVKRIATNRDMCRYIAHFLSVGIELEARSSWIAFLQGSPAIVISNASGSTFKAMPGSSAAVESKAPDQALNYPIKDEGDTSVDTRQTGRPCGSPSLELVSSARTDGAPSIPVTDRAVKLRRGCAPKRVDGDQLTSAKATL